MPEGRRRAQARRITGSLNGFGALGGQLVFIFFYFFFLGGGSPRRGRCTGRPAGVDHERAQSRTRRSLRVRGAWSVGSEARKGGGGSSDMVDSTISLSPRLRARGERNGFIPGFQDEDGHY